VDISDSVGNNTDLSFVFVRRFDFHIVVVGGVTDNVDIGRFRKDAALP
jgi:hypothetical protein